MYSVGIVLLVLTVVLMDVCFVFCRQGSRRSIGAGAAPGIHGILLASIWHLSKWGKMLLTYFADRSIVLFRRES